MVSSLSFSSTEEISDSINSAVRVLTQISTRPTSWGPCAAPDIGMMHSLSCHVESTKASLLSKKPSLSNVERRFILAALELLTIWETSVDLRTLQRITLKSYSLLQRTNLSIANNPSHGTSYSIIVPTSGHLSTPLDITFQAYSCFRS